MRTQPSALAEYKEQKASQTKQREEHESTKLIKEASKFRNLLSTRNSFYFLTIAAHMVNNKMTLSPQVKQKISIVLNISKTAFHWGFIPALLYLG